MSCVGVRFDGSCFRDDVVWHDATSQWDGFNQAAAAPAAAWAGRLWWTNPMIRA